MVKKIGFLTSSRADIGIYTPLISAMVQDSRFVVEAIAFGTHLSPYHGFTIELVEKLQLDRIHQVFGMPLSDHPIAIANSYGNLVANFAQFYGNHSFDVVLALGDRYEMSAAIQAGIPIGVNFAHLHGGETTLGAIDNIYRHQITLASKYHFVSNTHFKQRVHELIGNSENVFHVGSLSLSDLKTISLPTWDDVARQFNIPFAEGFCLVTCHPETMNFGENQHNAEILGNALRVILEVQQIVATMPNADTEGSIFRNMFINLQNEHPDRVVLIENFGRKNYFAALKACTVCLGNSSSGIIEAASFGAWVLNIGTRQSGRPQNANTINCNWLVDDIVEKAKSLAKKKPFSGENIYFKDQTVDEIINTLLHV